MKQNIKIGNAVDDGFGDYLRAGGIKTNSNFDEIYYELGDGSVPHAAGAWKTVTAAQSTVVNAKFGAAYAVNSTLARMTINLPKGTTADYNKVIRIRDVFATWRTNPVTIAPAQGDTLKGEAISKTFNTNYTDLELVYCTPGRWEYISNKQVDRISNADLATVARQEFIATEGQTDFLNVFPGYSYNVDNTQVYHRGNLLYYGNKATENSDYGSPGATAGSIVDLDGKNIRLRQPCMEGDTLIVVTFMDGIAQWRASYNRRDLTILDKTLTDDVSISGARYVDDLRTLTTIPMSAFGQDESDQKVNPNTFEVYINGIIQHEAGRAGLPMFRCDGADGLKEDDCVANGGIWVGSHTDYTYTVDNNTNITSLTFDRKFEHGDTISLRWFNNDIGTTLELDDIIEAANDRYVMQGQPKTITGAVRITDYNNPAWPNVELEPAYDTSISSAYSIFDMIYPVGTVYENAVNPNNPSTYLMAGMWKLWGQKQVTVGWTDDRTDTMFGLNNNHKDANGNPNPTAGGTGGTRSISIVNENLPITRSAEKVLVVDQNGSIIVGGCQFDPDDEGPAYTKYREDFLATNPTHTTPNQINTMNPYITVYRWMRIA